MVLTECVEMLVLVCGLSILPLVLSKWICIQVFRLILYFFVGFYFLLFLLVIVWKHLAKK